MLVFAIVFISAALVLYTFGVWGEKLSGKLDGKFLALFWLGLACDTTGTILMGRLSGAEAAPGFHAVTGALAIVLMLLHAVWASLVLWRRDERAAADFHRFSLIVWYVWLLPYLSGVVLGMGGGAR